MLAIPEGDALEDMMLPWDREVLDVSEVLRRPARGPGRQRRRQSEAVGEPVSRSQAPVADDENADTKAKAKRIDHAM